MREVGIPSSKSHSMALQRRESGSCVIGIGSGEVLVVCLANKVPNKVSNYIQDDRRFLKRLRQGQGEGLLGTEFVVHANVVNCGNGGPCKATGDDDNLQLDSIFGLCELCLKRQHNEKFKTTQLKRQDNDKFSYI